MTMTADPKQAMVQNLFDQIRTVVEEIEVLDSKLGVSGGKLAQRNALARQILADNTTNEVNHLVTAVEKAIVRDFSDSDVSAVAAYTALNAVVDKVLGDRVRKYLATQIPDNAVSTSTLSAEEKMAAEKTRSERYEFFKTMEKMLPFYGEELPADITRPVARRGSIGPRGPEWKGADGYVFSINGSELAAGTKISTLSNNHLKSANLSTKELRDEILRQLQAQGIDLGETKNEKGEPVSYTLPDTWSVKIGEKTLSARQTSADAPDTDDEPEVEMGNSFGESDLS